MIAVTVFPPTPATVSAGSHRGGQASGDDSIQFRQVMFAIGVSCGGVVGFDAAEETAHHVFGLQAQVLEGFAGDRAGEERLMVCSVQPAG
jgi:hypothetical protein